LDFALAASPADLEKFGFLTVDRVAICSNYLTILRSISLASNQTILEIEIFLARAIENCDQILPTAEAVHSA
jgi:hypothetical protein